MGYLTAEKKAEILDRAVEAVRDYYGTPRTGEEAGTAEKQTRDAVGDALWLAGATAARIASVAGVRQLLVARLVDDPERRREALVAARHDVDRHREDVMAAIRAGVMAEYRRELDGGKRPNVTALADRWGIARQGLYDWLRQEEEATS